MFLCFWGVFLLFSVVVVVFCFLFCFVFCFFVLFCFVFFFKFIQSKMIDEAVLGAYVNSIHVF